MQHKSFKFRCVDMENLFIENSGINVCFLFFRMMMMDLILICLLLGFLRLKFRSKVIKLLVF